MRTSARCAVVAALVLGASATAEEGSAVDGSAPGAVSVALGGEVTLVGLTFGARGEFLFRPGARGTASHVRLAVGTFFGPEQFFLPISLGYRAHYRDGKLLQPILGVGLEGQLRAVSDLAPVGAFGFYGEAGLALGLPRGFWLGALFSFDLMLYGAPGFGFGPRLSLGFRPST